MVLNQQQPQQPQQGGFLNNPNLGTALMGIGHGMTALSQGQAPNLAPYAAAMDKKKSPLDELLADPMRRKALAQMPPQMAERILMQAMFGVDMPQADPMDALRQEKLQLEIDQMRNPQQDPWAGVEMVNGIPHRIENGQLAPVPGYQAPAPDHPSDVREYEYAKSQGYQGSFMDFQRDIAEASRSSTTINNNLPGGGQMPGLGKLGEGYTYLYNDDGSVRIDENGMPMSSPVPGGPADVEAQEASRADERRQAAEQTQANVVSLTAQRAREAAGNRNFGAAGTSVVGIAPWTDSAEVMRQTKALKDMASASFLNAMRQQSKTGGALGNVTERELDLLGRQAGALDPNSPNFLRDLDDYERALLEVIHGGKPSGPTPIPQRPETPDFDSMTTEEIEKWLEQNG